MPQPKPVYLAGPDVFLPESADVGRRKQEICAQHGFEGVYPGEGVDLDALPESSHAQALFDACISMMDRCVAGLCNLTPFRGPSADVGTAFEMGYLFARGVPVLGYTSHEHDYATRVGDSEHMVEGFGLADNLMLEGPMLRHELTIVRAQEREEPALAALTAFERTVALLAERLA
ncbi:MAG: nucleoside 2-deoxyribosyltransferase [Acidimicrobiia bacterium]